MKMLMVLASALLLIGCENGAKDLRVQRLEARVDAVEKQLKAKNDADVDRQMKLEHCVNVDAHDAYWNHVEMNGKPISNKPGAYTAPGYVWDDAQKLRNSKIEECKILYGR